MTATSQDKQQLWDEFRTTWPIERLQSMTLDEYARVQDKNCFTYWIESRTEDIGSMWGGSAFKFGIYARRDLTPKTGDDSVRYGSRHAWVASYGEDETEAFQAVRAQVAAVARAAARGDAAAVEAAELGPVFKWKIAFLYQDWEHPQWLAVFSARDLCAGLGRFAGYQEDVGELQAEARRRYSDPDIFAASDRCWREGREWQKRHQLSEQLIATIQSELERFRLVNETQKMCGYRLNGHLPFALTREGKTATVFAPQGEWTAACTRLLKRIYRADEPRHSNLRTCCPEAATGQAAVALNLKSAEDFDFFVAAYEGGELPQSEVQALDNEVPANAAEIEPTNQILYGPPGTGKTYATIDEALRLLDPVFLGQVQASARPSAEKRAKLKERFDELHDAKRIQFVTFHQSFSYEDFVEGIRARATGSGALTYEVKPGVFRAICEEARRNRALDKKWAIRQDATVWKISIGEASGEKATREFCLSHGEARIGWHHIGDLKAPGLNLADPRLELGPRDQESLDRFASQMMEGDIVVCLSSLSTICAVGVVAGPYAYTPSVPSAVRADYVHMRPVNWLLKDITFDITSLNDGKGLRQQTVYPLTRIQWPQLYAALIEAGHTGLRSGTDPVEEKLPHLLIIDEINRGNMSRIFGELITLLEPSKREGRPEALYTTLPYSNHKFSVPDNLHVLGTMNTADRSLSSLDLALRRRFTFKEMPPQPHLLNDIMVEGWVPVGEMLATMNQRIEVLLDRDHQIGHSYFMPLHDDPSLQRLAAIFRRQIIPLLKEYFFENWERIQWVLNDHRKPSKLRFIEMQDLRLVELFGDGPTLPTRPSWRLDQDAFDDIRTYAGIIDADRVKG